MNLRVLAGAALMALAGCDAAMPDETLRPRAPVSSATSSDTRVVGLVGTLSGRDAWRGEDAFEGADVAIGELNRNIDAGRPPFELVTRDDGGDPAMATQLVEQLASSDRTVGIVYAGPPEALPAAEAALSQAGVPAIICYGDLYSARLLRPHIFQASPPLVWQARTIARYLNDDRGYARVGVLASRSLRGDTAIASMRDAAREQGLQIGGIARYREDDDPARALAKLETRNVEAIIVEGDAALLLEVLDAQRRRGHRYLSTAKARIASASPRLRRQRLRRDWWRPQVVGFDQTLSPAAPSGASGTVVADSYARGAHLLPIPSLERFRARFVRWWDNEAYRHQHRAYDAVHSIGWASRNARPGGDLAVVLEAMRGVRFGGLDITFGPDDHTAVEQTTIGLWVVPRARLAPAGEFPWLPLARGFSIDGDRTAIASEDWKYLFRNPPPPDGPAPPITRMRYAVSSPGSDPIH